MCAEACDHIVVIGGDDPTRSMLRFLLTEDGYTVREVATLAQVPSADSVSAAALVLAVLETPPNELAALVTTLRRRGYQGTLLLLVYELSPDQRRHAFVLGVRDVILWPARPTELLARLRAAGGDHIHHHHLVPYPPIVRAGGLTFHAAAGLLDDGRGGHIHLTPRETAVLVTLMQRPGRPVGRQDLIDAVWGIDYQGDGNALDVTMTHLRRKLAPFPPAHRYVRTVRGKGFVFDARVRPRDGVATEPDGRPRVLIVDDDVATAGMMREALEVAGYIVACALGQDALAWARQWRPAVILLDLMMPGMDGVAVQRGLLEHEPTAGIPVIAMSAGSNLRAHAAEMEAVDYLAKPFEVDELLLRVEKWAGPATMALPSTTPGLSANLSRSASNVSR